MNEIQNFLNSNESACQIGKHDYVKGAALILSAVCNGEPHEFSVFPVYSEWASANPEKQAICEQFGIPTELDLDGYWIPDRKLFITFSCRREYDDIPGITTVTQGELIKSAKQRIADRSNAWIDENFDSINPADSFVEDTVNKLFASGHKNIDLLEILDNSKTTVEERVLKPAVIDIFGFIYGQTDAEDAIVEKAIQAATAYIAEKKADRAELIRLVKEASDTETPKGRAREVKSVFLDMQNEGMKNCYVTFDFGYARVTKKVSLSLGYTWIENTQIATKNFVDTFTQPVTMQRSWTHPEDFLAYAIEVKAKNRVFYTAEPLKNAPENELYSFIFNLYWEGDCDLKKFEGKNFDCSIPLCTGEDILCAYVKQFYSTLEGAKFLIRHGADADAAYEFMVKNNNSSCRHSALATSSYSRNWDEILKYLSEMQAGKSGETAKTE